MIYRVELYAVAQMQGCVIIEDAANVEEAREKALKDARSGEVDWHYYGTVDGSEQTSSVTEIECPT